MFKSLFNKFILNGASTKKCSFCACSENTQNPIIVAYNSSICSNCVLSAYKILFGEVEPSLAKEDWDDEYDDIDFLDSIRKVET